MSNWKNCELYSLLEEQELVLVKSTDVRNVCLADLTAGELADLHSCLSAHLGAWSAWQYTGGCILLEALISRAVERS